MKALEIDESRATAHNALGDVKKGYDWGLPGGLVEYRRALPLNPSHLFARLWYAECLARAAHGGHRRARPRGRAHDPKRRSSPHIEMKPHGPLTPGRSIR